MLKLAWKTSLNTFLYCLWLPVSIMIVFVQCVFLCERLDYWLRLCDSIDIHAWTPMKDMLAECYSAHISVEYSQSRVQSEYTGGGQCFAEASPPTNHTHLAAVTFHLSSSPWHLGWIRATLRTILFDLEQIFYISKLCSLLSKFSWARKSVIVTPRLAKATWGMQKMNMNWKGRELWIMKQLKVNCFN